MRQLKPLAAAAREARAMRTITLLRIAMLLLLALIPATAVAQSDLCWRDSYPWIPGEWAGSGLVVDAGNRFQAVTGATLELWTTTYHYDEARQNAIRHQLLPARLVETSVSDGNGAFALKALQRDRRGPLAFYEIRAHMPGRESGLAYIEIGTGKSPQWMGRGIRVALSRQEGCSRIYSAGLDDTDCGVLDCANLPVGPATFVFSDGTPLAATRLAFYQHSKSGSHNPEFSLTTDRNGMVTTPAQRGCFDVAIERGGSMHLCFSGQPASGPITVLLPPKRAAKAPRRVVNAYCDDVGAHIVYDSGPRFVRRTKRHQRCADLRVSEDRRDVGWLMESEATSESDGKIIQRWTQSDLFVNGIQVEYDGPALYAWRFHNGSRQVVFEAGPLHGGGNMFLYDIDKRQVIDRCMTRQDGVTCPAWATAKGR